jgi:hypothetical protein
MVSSAFSDDDRCNWDDQLDYATFVYKTAVHAATGYNPFYLMYYREQNVPLDLVFDNVLMLSTITSTLGEYSHRLEQLMRQANKTVVENK